jgi:DNA-binding beta-propeller fold protein YncE
MNSILGCQHANSSASRLGSFDQKPSQWTMPVLALLVLLCGMTAAVQAQTAVYNGGITSTINSTTFAGPMGVTTDSSGDIFVADNNFAANTATVYEMTYTAGTGTYSAPLALPGPVGGFLCPAAMSESDPCLRGVAIDHNGNLWVAAFGGYEAPAGTPAGQVYVYSSGTSQPPVSVGTGTWESPWGITADTSGNVYVTDNAAQTITEIANGATPAPTLTVVYTYGPGGIQQPRGIAVDSSENLYVIDGNVDQVKELTAASSYATINTVSPGFQGPGDLSLDTSGNIWVSEYSTGLVRELAGWNATTSTFATVLSWGTGLSGPVSVRFDSTTGNILVSDNGNHAIKQIALQPANFGSLAVGSPATQTVTFTFTGSSTTINPPVVVTQGPTATGKDFTDAGGGTCTTVNGAGNPYASGATCTVNVKFQPTAPGLRFGAVELENTSGTVLATASLYGTGTGPEIVFDPGKATTPFTGLGRGVLLPEKIAVDSSGNVFIVDNNGGIFEITAGTTAANRICCATSLSEPYGIAIDGAGNLFVTQSTGVYEILAPGYTTVQQLASGFSFSFPLGLAFDGNGNLYVADASAANKVDELTWASGYSNVITLSHPFGKPFGVAVDTSGNIWVADYGLSPIAPSVTELSPTGTVSGAYSGFITPEAVAVDPAGNVYVADYDGSTITELIAANSYASVTLASSASVPAITNPAGVALDSAGNVYYTTNGTDDSAYELNFASAPALAFGSVPYQTTSSTQSVTVTNIGTTGSGSDLNLTALAASTSFTLGTSAGDCTAPFSLASDTSCALSITFTPQSTGSIPGTATITDNAAGSPQIINLSGSGSQVTPTVGLDMTSSSISYGTPETFFAYLPSAATGTVTFYNGSTVLGTGTVNGGTATFSSSTLATGSYSITAAYPGDSNYNSNTSSPQSLTVYPAPATMASPTPGKLTSAPTTFTWIAPSPSDSVTGYYLNIGTSLGGANLVNIGPLSNTSTSATVNLPTNGVPIFVRLWTVFNSTAEFSNDYSYTEFTQSGGAITSPANGSGLGGASTTFDWSAGTGGVTGYYLHVGTTSGAANLVNIGPLVGTSATVTLPTSGATIYAQLQTNFSGGGTALSSINNYTEATQSGGAITGPVPGSFAFTTPTTVPTAGTDSESVTLTPADTTDYKTATGTSPLTVTGQTLTVTANDATKLTARRIRRSPAVFPAQ